MRCSFIKKVTDEDYDAFVKLQQERYYGDSEDALNFINTIWDMRDTEEMTIFSVDGKGFMVVSDPESDFPNVGIDLFDDCIGKGYAVKALRKLDYESVRWETEENNQAAIRVAEKMSGEILGEEMLEGYRFLIWAVPIGSIEN